MDDISEDVMARGSDKEKLLFEEQLAPYSNSVTTFGGALVFFIFIFLEIISINGIISQRVDIMTGIGWFVLVAVALLPMSYVYLLKRFTRRPLHIYETGFTRIHVAIWRGLLKRDVFIAWNRLNKVVASQHRPWLTKVLRLEIKIIFDGWRRESISSADIGFHGVQNSLTILKRYIPDKLDISGVSREYLE